MGAVGAGRPKALLPVLGRPLIDWQLERLRGAGLREGCLVVGHHAERLLAHVGDGARFDLSLSAAHQDRPLGIAHAIACAAGHLRGPFVCLLGDTWVEKGELVRLVRTFRESAADGALGVLPQADAHTRARNYAVTLEALPGRDWTRVTAVREKPRDGLAGPAGVGLYAFRTGFLEAVERTEPSALRGEREITDAIAEYLADGARILGVPLAGPDFNLSGPAELLALNLHELARTGRETWVAPDATVEGGAVLHRAVVGAGTRIARGARLERALVLEGEVVPAGTYTDGVFADGRWVGAT